TDHGELDAVQANGPAHDGRIGGEFVPPEVGAQNDDGIATGHLVLVLAKAAAQGRLDTEYLEVVAGYHHAAADAGRGRGVAAEADGFHGCIREHAAIAGGPVADVQVFAIGKVIEGVVVRGANESDDTAGMRNRIGTENQGVEHAERG